MSTQRSEIIEAFSDIADAIRAKGVTGTMTPSEMPSKIAQISGSAPSGNKQITDTNVTDVASYSTAQVVDANLKSENIISGKTVLGITGSATVPSGNVNITDTNSKDVTQYATAQVYDENLKSENIVSGKTVLGIAGSAPVPSGNKAITDTHVVDVSAYETAQVTDNNLLSENIVTGKTILGVEGSAVVPSGNINITNTNSTDVTNYATAQVVDANLIAANIITGKTILGIIGSAIVPSGTYTTTASTSQKSLNISKYYYVKIKPTPSESKTLTLGSEAPSTVSPSSGKLLSSVPVTIDTSVIKAENIITGVTLLGITGTAIVPSGIITIQATTALESTDVTNYVDAMIKPTPTESKTLTLGANAPSTVSPSAGKHLSSVPVSLDTSVIKAENIAKDVQILGITGTHEGGSSGFITNKLNGQIFFATSDGSASHVYTVTKTILQWLLWTTDGIICRTNDLYTFPSEYYFSCQNEGLLKPLYTWGDYYDSVTSGNSNPNIAVLTSTNRYEYGSASATIVPSTNTINFYSYDQRMRGPFEQRKVYIMAIATDGSVDGDYCILTGYDSSCFTADTLITLADKSTKKARDITYDDDLLIFDFDKGTFGSAKPLWIKKIEKSNTYNHLVFHDGRTLDTINDHRIFVRQHESFQFGMKVPLHIQTFTDEDKFISLSERSVIEEEVEYCNIITNYHQNLFANGILTSCKTNNLYPIRHMSFDKQAYSGFAPGQIPTKQDYLDFGIDEYFIDGMRLCEFPQRLLRDKDKVYFERLKALMLAK